MRIGLTGGIGSGKSTVSALLAQHGAVVIDADKIAREVVEPGTVGLQRIRGEFGDAVITDDGSLNRPALGAIVFADADRRRALEAITHPLIAAQTEALFAAAGDDAIVVHDMPLLVEIGQTDRYHLMVIVDVPEHLRLERLVSARGMDRMDAQARIRAQATDEQRREAADVLLDNSGTPVDLETTVTALWGERIRPYADNLAADRGVRELAAETVETDEAQRAAQGRRLRRRLSAQLGAAGFDDARVDEVGSGAASNVIELPVAVPDLTVAEWDSFRGALRAAGMVDLAPAAEQRYEAFGADPALLVHVHITGDNCR